MLKTYGILGLWLALAGCTGPVPIQGGAPCDTTWDRIDYKYYNKYWGGSDTGHNAQERK